jgi:ATP-binding cassette subfamily B protein
MAVFLLTGAILWITEPIIGLIILIGFPFYLFFAYRYAGVVEPIRRQRAKRMERLTSVSQEVFRGIEVVRAFGKEGYEKDKFHETSLEYAESVAKEGELAAFYIPQLILVAITVFAFLFGGLQVLSGFMTVGVLVQTLALLLALDGQSAWVPRSLLTLRGAFVNADRILDLLRWSEPLIEPEMESPQLEWGGDIVFEDVSFAYPNGDAEQDSFALGDISFTIPGGSKVALIGGPGGGKSSILKLLLRFYDPSSGRITIGGTDLKNVRTSDVRRHVGLVEQDIFLFKMSIKDNIAFGKEDATEEEIIEAAKKAQAHDFIMSFPQGYETQVGERGFTLSGGQRQRLAIARTLLYEPSILLLDDSTSAIDARTEYLMRKALDMASEGRTSITVTQRLRTLLESDLVIIVDRGQLIAIGSHEDLLETSVEYRRIFEALPETRHMVENVALVGGAA